MKSWTFLAGIIGIMLAVGLVDGLMAQGYTGPGSGGNLPAGHKPRAAEAVSPI